MSHTGSVFELTIDGTPVRCLILLDILDPIERRQLADDSPLRFFQEAELIQVLDGDERAVGPSFFADRVALDDGAWNLVAERAVKAEDLEFPIYLTAIQSEVHVVRGEVALPVDVSHADYLRQRRFGRQHPSGSVDLLAAVLRGLPIPGGRSAQNVRRGLEKSDLRFDDSGGILTRVGQGMDEPYHVFSKRHGFDPARLLG